MHCGIILLAAGGSLRLGKPKQLLLYKGQTLLNHSLRAAIATCKDNVVVVTGSNAAIMQREIDEKTVTIVVNSDWQKGMASSIVKGLTMVLEKHPLTDAVMIMACDQPFIDAKLLKELMKTQQQTGKWIVTSDYGDTTGPPTLFHKELFEELRSLEGDKGARMIVGKHTNETTSVSFPLGRIDIDTIEDYETLIQKNNNK